MGTRRTCWIHPLSTNNKPTTLSSISISATPYVCMHEIMNPRRKEGKWYGYGSLSYSLISK
jgi:hypothetical protein